MNVTPPHHHPRQLLLFWGVLVPHDSDEADDLVPSDDEDGGGDDDDEDDNDGDEDEDEEEADEHFFDALFANVGVQGGGQGPGHDGSGSSSEEGSSESDGEGGGGGSGAMGGEEDGAAGDGPGAHLPFFRFDMSRVRDAWNAGGGAAGWGVGLARVFKCLIRIKVSVMRDRDTLGAALRASGWRPLLGRHAVGRKEYVRVRTVMLLTRSCVLLLLLTRCAPPPTCHSCRGCGHWQEEATRRRRRRRRRRRQ